MIIFYAYFPKLLWLSDEGLPQYVIFDLRKLLERPKQFKCIGFDCWHDYNSNPKRIEISLSTDCENFITWTTFLTELVNIARAAEDPPAFRLRV